MSVVEPAAPAPTTGLAVISRRTLPRSAFAVSGASILAGLTLALVPATATPGGRRPADNVQRTQRLAVLGRPRRWPGPFVNADGIDATSSRPTRSRSTPSQTKDLRGRQRVLISWKGAQPSGGRASNPYGENGLQQEYPVVILQCRGIDDPSLPIEKQVRPETCWTGSVAQRSQITRSDGEATWIHDLDADRGRQGRGSSGMTPFPGTERLPDRRRRPVLHAT